MNKITKILIIFMFFSINISIVNAESGNIELTSISTKSYSATDAASANTPNWTSFNFDTSNYNYLSDFSVKKTGYQVLTFTNDFEVTTFICDSGCSGSPSGYAWYDKNTSKVYWVFSQNALITSTSFHLTYANNIFANISHSSVGWMGTTTDKAVTTPLIMNNIGGSTNPRQEFDYIVQVVNVVTNSYELTYPLDGKFLLSVEKPTGSIITKWEIKNATTRLNIESSFNAVNFQYMSDYTTGVIVNVSTASTYKEVILNSTVLNAPEISDSTGSIIFNKTSYDFYDDLNVSWNISNLNSNFGYYFTLKNSDTQEIITSYNIYNSSGYQVIKNFILKTPSQSNYYEVYLTEVNDSDGFNTIFRTLALKQCYYGSSKQYSNSSITGNFSILNTNKQVIQGNNLNLKYNLSSDGSIVIYDSKNRWEYPLLKGTNINKNLYIPINFEIGTSSISLFYYDIYIEDYNMLHTDSFIVLPISNSSLIVDKQSYNQGNTITGKAFNTNTGYLNIVNPNSIIVDNQTVTGNTTLSYSYTTNINSIRGTWMIYLYDYNGVLLNSTQTYLNYGIPTATGTATATATATTEQVSLLDITNSISIGLLGNMDTDNNGDFSESEIKTSGNKFMSTLVLIVFICLIFGVYYSIKGRKK